MEPDWTGQHRVRDLQITLRAPRHASLEHSFGVYECDTDDCSEGLNHDLGCGDSMPNLFNDLATIERNECVGNDLSNP